jgi:CubicO group peptidase (beta-lactamase class C family)
MADGWPVAAPAKEGLDPKLVCAIGRHFENWQEADPHGVVVVRHGVLVYDHYFTGDDERDWKPLRDVPHDASTLHNMESITKSVVALLVGIAFDRGWLTNLNAPVFSFFPEYADLRNPDNDGVTLRDLLTMTSGLAWPEHSLPYNNPANLQRQMAEAPDPYRFVLEQPVETTPGTMWNYNGAGVRLLGVILKKVSAVPLDQFAKEGLFDPLGIKDWEWERLANGDPNASGGLRLRPRDLAKIGQLVLDHGAWHGKQIVSAAWIRDMIASHSPPGWVFTWGGDAYGYLWWLGRSTVDGRDIDWVGGNGYGGQRLYVVPSLNLVVVVTAGIYEFSSAQTLAGDGALNTVLRAALDH